MKLLRDVARRSASTSDPWYEGADSEGGYWGEPIGGTGCCGWNYSSHAIENGLIRHFNSCDNFNPQGLNEF